MIFKWVLFDDFDSMLLSSLNVLATAKTCWYIFEIKEDP